MPFEFSLAHFRRPRRKDGLTSRREAWEDRMIAVPSETMADYRRARDRNHQGEASYSPAETKQYSRFADRSFGWRTGPLP